MISDWHEIWGKSADLGCLGSDCLILVEVGGWKIWLVTQKKTITSPLRIVQKDQPPQVHSLYTQLLFFSHENSFFMTLIKNIWQ